MFLEPQVVVPCRGRKAQLHISSNSRSSPANNQFRQLQWDPSHNARDWGENATADGGRTRWGAFVRADNMSRLTPAGQVALIAYGVRTLIDLRRADELTIDLNPFAPPSE